MAKIATPWGRPEPIAWLVGAFQRAAKIHLALALDRVPSPPVPDIDKPRSLVKVLTFVSDCYRDFAVKVDPGCLWGFRSFLKTRVEIIVNIINSSHLRIAIGSNSGKRHYVMTLQYAQNSQPSAIHPFQFLSLPVSTVPGEQSVDRSAIIDCP